MTTQPELDVVVDAGLDRRLPALLARGAIGLVHGGEPARAQDRFGRLREVALHHRVDVVERALRGRGPHLLRDALGDEPVRGGGRLGLLAMMPRLRQRVLQLVTLALALVEHRRLLPDRLAGAVQLDEDVDLGAQDVRIERLRQVVDGTVRVALGDVGRRVAERAEEDDRRAA